MVQVIRHMDGFEDFATADLGIQGYSTRGVTVVSGASGSFTGARFGSRYAVGGNDNSGYFQFGVGTSEQFWSVGYGYWYAGANSILTFSSGGGVVALMNLDGSNHFRWYSGNGSVLRATSTGTIPAGWFHLAVVVKFDTTSGGYMNLHINGNSTPFLSWSGITASASVADSVNIGASGWSSLNYCAYDDIVIATGDAGSEAANYLGDLAVGTLFPNGAGNSTQMTPLAGSNWDAVNDATEDGDSTYVEDNVSGHKDTYTLTNPAYNGTVLAIQPVVIARKDQPGSVAFHSVHRLSGTEVNGTDIYPGMSYTVYKQDVYATKPGGGAWTITDLTDLELGVQIV